MDEAVQADGAARPADRPDAGAAHGWRRRLLMVAKLAVSAGLLYWLLAVKLDVREAATQLAAVRPWPLAGAMALVLVGYLLITVRWQAILAALALRMDLRTLLVITWIGMFFNQSLPSNVGGDVVRVWRVLRQGSSLGRAVSSVMIDRVMAVVAIAFLVLVLLPMSARMIGGPAFWALPMLAGTVAAGIAVLLRLDRVVRPARRIMPARLEAAAAALARDARAAFLDIRHGSLALGVALLNQLLIAAVVYLLAVGLGIRVGMVEVLVLFPPVLLVSLLPVSFAGWGVRELGMVTAFGFVGVPAGQSGALSIAFGLVVLASALPGGLLWLAGGGRRGAAAAGTGGKAV